MLLSQTSLRQSLSLAHQQKLDSLPKMGELTSRFCDHTSAHGALRHLRKCGVTIAPKRWQRSKSGWVGRCRSRRQRRQWRLRNHKFVRRSIGAVASAHPLLTRVPSIFLFFLTDLKEPSELMVLQALPGPATWRTASAA
eukprot:SAG11_NODE_17_length_26125_cov_45.892723_8_plen_139_part_00